MISLLLKGDAPGAVRSPAVMSSDLEGPIFGLLLFDTFAVSSMDEEVGRPPWQQAERRWRLRLFLVCRDTVPKSTSCSPRRRSSVEMGLRSTFLIDEPVLSQPIKAETRI